MRPASLERVRTPSGTGSPALAPSQTPAPLWIYPPRFGHIGALELQREGALSLDKIRNWVATTGRVDVTKDRTDRELAVLKAVTEIALDLDGVVLHQGAKAGKGGEQHDLNFARRMEGRKTPVLFCGVLFRPRDKTWFRRQDITTVDAVRVYLRTTEAAGKASPWAERIHSDDGLKSDPEWRYLEIPPGLDMGGEELRNLIEDAYFQVAGM